MRKRLVFLVVLLFVVPVVWATGEVISNLAPSTDSNEFIGTQFGTMISQSFNKSNAMAVDSVSYKIGVNSNNIVGVIVRIETDNGSGYPSGTLVDVNAWKNVTGNTAGVYTAYFSSNISLSKDVNYHLVFKPSYWATGFYSYLILSTSSTYDNGTFSCQTQAGGSFGGCNQGYWTSKVKDVWFQINGTDVIPTIPVVDLSSFNVSSAVDYGNETVWSDVSTLSPSVVRDQTPTVRFSTSNDAFCRLGLSDSNWSSLGGSRDCNTSSSGSTSHVCSLTDSLVVDSGFNSLFIGCIDSTLSLENVSSSVGALNVSLDLWSVQGWVFDNESSGLGGVNVSAVEMDVRDNFVTSLTNGSGFYNLTVYSGDWMLWAYEPGNVSRWAGIKHYVSVP